MTGRNAREKINSVTRLIIREVTDQLKGRNRKLSRVGTSWQRSMFLEWRHWKSQIFFGLTPTLLREEITKQSSMSNDMLQGKAVFEAFAKQVNKTQGMNLTDALGGLWRWTARFGQVRDFRKWKIRFKLYNMTMNVTLAGLRILLELGRTWPMFAKWWVRSSFGQPNSLGQWTMILLFFHAEFYMMLKL